MSRFERYINKYLELSLPGEEEKIRLKPMAEDQELLMIVYKPDIKQIDAQKMTQIFTNMIKRANPDITDVEMKNFLGFHYIDLLGELFIALGLQNREEIQKGKQ